MWPFKKKPKVEKPVRLSLRRDHDLYGTYIVIEPDTDLADLIAIQDWVKEHSYLHYDSLPVSDIAGRANREGKAYICIDESGLVFNNNGPHHSWRKLEINLRPYMAWYNVEPKTIEVAGKRYDREEALKVLSTLTPKD